MQPFNRLVLSCDPYKSRVYGTFQQIRANGVQVRKGEKSTIVVFWKSSVEKDEITGETKKMFLLKFYHVFNSNRPILMSRASSATQPLTSRDGHRRSVTTRNGSCWLLQGQKKPPIISWAILLLSWLLKKKPRQK